MQCVFFEIPCANQAVMLGIRMDRSAGARDLTFLATIMTGDFDVVVGCHVDALKGTLDPFYAWRTQRNLANMKA